MIDEKRENTEINTEFVITEPYMYQVFKEHFESLFDVVDIDDKGKEMLALLSNLLTNLIIEEIRN